MVHSVFFVPTLCCLVSVAGYKINKCTEAFSEKTFQNTHILAIYLDLRSGQSRSMYGMLGWKWLIILLSGTGKIFVDRLQIFPGGLLMCRDQRVCEADRDIFFSIL